ncbi:hypothetical protein FH972_006596 [Carpinus fangiana]|uniref:Transmembrane protein n=1 Tax=Carpinus fangiana TaxID=176857 RepID=A0A5N6QTS7_9ROSI|nr:hypothetical protein FH972_006596 [Carpinus fangiana]
MPWGSGSVCGKIILVIGKLIVALFVGLIVWVILIAVGLVGGSSTVLRLGLNCGGTVKRRVKTQREVPTVLVGRPVGLGGRERGEKG